MAGKEQMYHVDSLNNFGESKDDEFRPLDAKGNEMDKEEAVVKLHGEANNEHANREAENAGAERAKKVAEKCSGIFSWGKEKAKAAMGWLGKMGLKVLGIDKYIAADYKQTVRDGRRLSDSVHKRAIDAEDRFADGFNRLVTTGETVWGKAVDKGREVCNNGRERCNGIINGLRNEVNKQLAEAAMRQVEKVDQDNANDIDQARALLNRINARKEAKEKFQYLAAKKNPEKYGHLAPATAEAPAEADAPEAAAA